MVKVAVPPVRMLVGATEREIARVTGVAVGKGLGVGVGTGVGVGVGTGVGVGVGTGVGVGVGTGVGVGVGTGVGVGVGTGVGVGVGFAVGAPYKACAPLTSSEVGTSTALTIEFMIAVTCWPAESGWLRPMAWPSS